MKNYKQLTYMQHCHISALKKSGMKQKDIADIINVDQSTISRELNRNKGERGYRHKQAQNKSKEVSAVIIQINNRPRKKIRYKIPVDLMAEYMAAIAA